MSEFNAYNWYWLADDGRLFSGAKASLISDTDADYVAWSEINMATPWPRDDEGNQTLAELQRVLLPYVIMVDLKAYAFLARDQKEHSGCPVSVGPITEVRTDAYTQSLISRYHQAAAANEAFTVAWILPDRSTTTLDKAAIDSLFSQTTDFIAGTYNTYSQVIGDIDGGSINSSDQIDQAFEGIPLQRSKPVDIGWQS
jgi:hypothetical protein